jgi:hypothetical protein
LRLRFGDHETALHPNGYKPRARQSEEHEEQEKDGRQEHYWSKSTAGMIQRASQATV